VVHLLDDDERRALSRLERAAIARAAIAGALSALIAGTTETLLQPIEEARPLVFWGVLGGVSALAAVLEIAFLSWDALRTAHALANAAGVSWDGHEEREQTLAVLARAALEVANPIESDVGVNPLKETPRWRLVLAGVAYKLKVSATNIVLKLIVRRALGRAAVRTWLHFLSVPVTAAWNAVVCARVLREVRVRVLGPSLVDDVVARLLPEGAPISAGLADAAPRAVAVAIVKSADLHPNLERLLRAVLARCGASPPDIDDTGAFVRARAALTDAERARVTALCRVAIVLDAKIPRRERLLAESIGVSGASLVRDRDRVLHGEPLSL
jgi:hypothetical protein